MDTIQFTVPGKPRPQGSKRGIGRVIPGRTPHHPRVAVTMIESSRHVGGWRERIALFARQAWPCDPLDGPVELEVTFYFLRPKSHFYTGRRAGVLRGDADPYPVGRSTHGDADKLLRAALDGIAGVIVQDDKLVVTVVARKRFATAEGARFIVRECRAPLPSESAAAPSTETLGVALANP